MTRYVAFLRAINVGGHIVKMDRLRELFLSAGLANVSTFIASGNVLFESKMAPTGLEALIEKTLQKALGYEVTTMLRSAAEVAKIIDRVDTLGLAGGPGGLYIGLLKATPSVHAATTVAAMSTEVDTLLVHGRELYWRCTRSFSDSTVAGPALGRALAVAMTTRNVNTVRRLAVRLASG